MGRLARMEPCPKCGSRDNLARYEDGGGYCFGCKHWEPRNAETYLSRIQQSSESRTETSLLASIWERSSRSLAPIAQHWLSQFQCDGADALRAGLRWHEQRQQLLFPLYDEEKQLRCIQARNFASEGQARTKYHNYGNKEEAFPLYQAKETSEGNTLSVVITEDILSALKVSKQVSAMPALGTSLSMNKALALQKRGFIKAFVWLDKDKWREGIEICDKFKWLGVTAKAIYTEKDPKEYNNEEIRNYLCQ